MRRALLLLAAASLAFAGCLDNGGGPSEGPGSEFPPNTDEACQGDVEAARPLVASMETSMGVIDILMATDGAPETAKNFVTLAEADFYDGILFHRVIGPRKSPPDGFMLQGGDPHTKDPSIPKERWGTGGSDKIPDEFHPDLQHDAAGVLSMANSGPNTGSSQFFITLGPTRHLDDKHAIFGHVIGGMDVVRAIGAVTTDGNDRPVEPVTILDVDVNEVAPEGGAAVHVYLADKTVGAGRSATFLVLGTNKGNVRDRVTFAAAAPPGWEATFDVPCAVVIPGAGRVSVLTVTPSADNAQGGNVAIRVNTTQGGAAETTAVVRVGDVGKEAVAGSSVEANYVGILENGRLFDTSVGAVANDPAVPKTARFQVRPSYSPFTFTVGTGVIEGFSKLATGAREGETPAGRIPPAEAYGERGGHHLAGKTLLFELQVLRLG